jgi:hypothetical protein
MVRQKQFCPGSLCVQASAVAVLSPALLLQKGCLGTEVWPGTRLGEKNPQMISSTVSSPQGQFYDKRVSLRTFSVHIHCVFLSLNLGQEVWEEEKTKPQDPTIVSIIPQVFFSLVSMSVIIYFSDSQLLCFLSTIFGYNHWKRLSGICLLHLNWKLNSKLQFYFGFKWLDTIPQSRPTSENSRTVIICFLK